MCAKGGRVSTLPEAGDMSKRIREPKQAHWVSVPGDVLGAEADRPGVKKDGCRGHGDREQRQLSGPFQQSREMRGRAGSGGNECSRAGFENVKMLMGRSCRQRREGQRSFSRRQEVALLPHGRNRTEDSVQFLGSGTTVLITKATLISKRQR